MAAHRRATTEGAGLRQAVPLFLQRWARKFDPHFKAEERASQAGVRSGFPAEIAGIDDVRRDREVVAALIDLLEARQEALALGEAEAEADVVAAIKDLTVLWQRHVRRREVLGRLLPPSPGERRG